MSGVGAKGLTLILMMSIFAGLSTFGVDYSPLENRHYAGSSPDITDSTHTDHGNGTATDSFFVGSNGGAGIQDTWLSAAQPTSNFGGDDELRIGFSANSSSRWNSLVGIDLTQANFYDNVTVTSATLALNLKQQSGNPTLRSWVCYDETWSASTTNWGSWSVGGALGNQDSGGLMDETTISNNSTWVELDVTRALTTAHYRYRTGMDPSASILITGPAWGEDWAVFRSSEYVFESERPRLNITYSWGTSTPSTTIDWVDVFPKAPHRIDADNQLTLSAQARSERGEALTYTPTWSANGGSIDSGGLFTPDWAGVVTVEASMAGVVGDLSLTVTPGTPNSLELETKVVGLTIDDTFKFNYSFIDSHGNDIVDSALTWYADKGIVNDSGFYEPLQLGADVVTVMWQNLYATADVTVTAGSAANITFEENLSVASGEQIPLNYEITDRLGNPLPAGSAGAIQWESENGHVDGVGVYTGDAVGIWRVYANSTNGASGVVDVEVTPGALSSIELVAPNGTQPADQAVLLIVNWLDVRGNVVPVRIPISNWTAEDGNFRMTPDGVEWLPRREGEWQVGVHVEDAWANATITVVHGAVDSILISTESVKISADAEIELVTLAEDSKGNRWQVESVWEAMEPIAAPWLSQRVEGVFFEGSLVGNWTVRAVHSGENSSFSQYLTIEVVAGSLASITVEGDGAEVSADGWHDFDVGLLDEDGNMIEGVLLNWTFEHNGEALDRTGEIRDNGGLWYPSHAGHHDISIEAAGVFASIGMDVSPGIAHTLRVVPPQGLVVTSGNVVQFEVRASDLDGNDFGTDVVWNLPHGVIDLTNGTRAGEYLLRGVETGTHELRYSSGLADGIVQVVVQTGEVVDIVLIPDRTSAKTGEVIELEVRGYDYGGNQVEINPDEVTISSSAGNIGHSEGGFWQISLKNSGSQQKISATYNGASGEAFLDVTPDPLRAFGDSNLATTLWAGIAVVVTMFVLLLIILRKRSVEERDRKEALMAREEALNPKDIMAGYRPSKRARARMRSKQAQSQLSGQGGWAGYQGAQQQFWREGGAQPSQPPAQTSFQTPNQIAQQPLTQQSPTHPAATQAGGQPVNPTVEHAPFTATEQGASQDASYQATDSTSDVVATEDEGLALDAWTTEQVWAWGRSQGWSDEQIASYEQVYEQTVRNPTGNEQQATIPQTDNTHSTVDQQVANDSSDVEESVSIGVVTGEVTTEGSGSEIASTEVVKPQTEEQDVRSDGIMKAMPGTTQGESGWYLDGEGNQSRWEIDDDGTWHRTG